MTFSHQHDDQHDDTFDGLLGEEDEISSLGDPHEMDLPVDLKGEGVTGEIARENHEEPLPAVTPKHNIESLEKTHEEETHPLPNQETLFLQQEAKVTQAVFSEDFLAYLKNNCSSSFATNYINQANQLIALLKSPPPEEAKLIAMTINTQESESTSMPPSFPIQPKNNPKKRKQIDNANGIYTFYLPLPSNDEEKEIELEKRTVLYFKNENISGKSTADRQVQRVKRNKRIQFPDDLKMSIVGDCILFNRACTLNELTLMKTIFNLPQREDSDFKILSYYMMKVQTTAKGRSRVPGYGYMFEDNTFEHFSLDKIIAYPLDQTNQSSVKKSKQSNPKKQKVTPKTNEQSESVEQQSTTTSSSSSSSSSWSPHFFSDGSQSSAADNAFRLAR